MNSLEIIGCGAGLRDGLNPCIFMSCTVFIFYKFWFKRSPLNIGWVGAIFCFAYMLSSLDFNFGAGQFIILQKKFMLAAKIIYFILGLGAFILGVMFFKDWLKLNRSASAKISTDEKIQTSPAVGILVSLGAVLLAIVLSALATLWPINTYVTLLGSEGIVRGQWNLMMPLLLSYIFTSMWPLWFVWVFLCIKNLQMSLLKIVCAAILFTASSSMILMFK